MDDRIVLNLIFVHYIFSWHIILHGGGAGLMLATVTWWRLGFWFGGSRRDRRFVLLAGGTIVALTQFVPILQLFLGLVGLWLVGGWTHGTVVAPLSEIQGFGATFITGGLLFFVTTLVGEFSRLIAESAGWRRETPRVE